MIKRDNVVVGKYTLESLTNGMYAMPLDLFREYIQNAVDSIDEAKEKLPFEEYAIDISLSENKRQIVISDNGYGISSVNAVQILIDIGNSQKDRYNRRGFRGIGRLAGLGYCDELIFETSFVGELEATKVRFDAELLRELMLDRTANIVSVEDVINRIVTFEKIESKVESHYFTVVMNGVTADDKLLVHEEVEKYLVQHAPLDYMDVFGWRSLIKEKTKLLGYHIPAYNIRLNGNALYKPYKNYYASDRVKRIDDHIREIYVEPFYRNEMICAIIWWGEANYFGTILDNLVKGIRVRQGNILIGTKTTCNSFFKEERFNGWLVGELFVLDTDLIVNARRDDFEKNEAYYDLMKWVSAWAQERTKEIRRISYTRSLSNGQSEIMKIDSVDKVEIIENEMKNSIYRESDFVDKSESDEVAGIDYLDKLTSLLYKKKNSTRYNAININDHLTLEQKRMLEKVFDVVVREFKSEEANKIINIIAANV